MMRKAFIEDIYRLPNGTPGFTIDKLRLTRQDGEYCLTCDNWPHGEVSTLLLTEKELVGLAESIGHEFAADKIQAARNRLALMAMPEQIATMARAGVLTEEQAAKAMEKWECLQSTQ